MLMSYALGDVLFIILDEQDQLDVMSIAAILTYSRVLSARFRLCHLINAAVEPPSSPFMGNSTLGLRGG
jgi:hypothetical protein